MGAWVRVLLIAAVVCGCHRRVVDAPKGVAVSNKETVYDFTEKTIQGKERKLSAYKGKVILIVNVASLCGFTPQYAGLQELYDRYRKKGFMILGFPANNFLHQEPGTNAEILKFCRTKYGVSFDMFSKISVKGKDQDPLYAYLTKRSPVPGKITWNFNKFLVDRDGRVVSRFDSKVTPLSREVTSRIEALLARK